MAFPGYPLDTNRTNSTPMSDRHPLDHEEERVAANDLQAQIDAINVNLAGFIPKSIVTDKGDIISSTGANVPVRMAAPADYGIFVSDSAEADGWRTVGNAFRYGDSSNITPAAGITLSAVELQRWPMITQGVTPTTGMIAVWLSFVNNTGGVLANGATIATLGAGWRPARTQARFPGLNASAGTFATTCSITTAGVITIAVGGGWTSPANGQTFEYRGLFATADA